MIFFDDTIAIVALVEMLAGRRPCSSNPPGGLVGCRCAEPKMWAGYVVGFDPFADDPRGTDAAGHFARTDSLVFQRRLKIHHRPSAYFVVMTT